MSCKVQASAQVFTFDEDDLLGQAPKRVCIPRTASIWSLPSATAFVLSPLFLRISQSPSERRERDADSGRELSVHRHAKEQDEEAEKRRIEAEKRKAPTVFTVMDLEQEERDFEQEEGKHEREKREQIAEALRIIGASTQQPWDVDDEAENGYWCSSR
jgi:hypothetical protein